MKTIEFKVGPRAYQLGYSWTDSEDLSRRLGGQSLQDMLAALGNLHPTTLNTFLFVGMAHTERTLKLPEVPGIVQAHLDAGGTLAELIGAVVEALQLGGVMRVRKDEEEASGSPGPRAGAREA